MSAPRVTVLYPHQLALAVAQLFGRQLYALCSQVSQGRLKSWRRRVWLRR